MSASEIYITGQKPWCNATVNDLTVNGTLDVATVVVDNLTVTTNLAVGGNETVAGTLTVTGQLLGSPLVVGSNLTVTGNEAIGGTLTVTGATTFVGQINGNGGNPLVVGSNVTMNDNLLLNGSSPTIQVGPHSTTPSPSQIAISSSPSLQPTTLSTDTSNNFTLANGNGGSQVTILSSQGGNINLNMNSGAGYVTLTGNNYPAPVSGTTTGMCLNPSNQLVASLPIYTVTSYTDTLSGPWTSASGTVTLYRIGRIAYFCFSGTGFVSYSAGGSSTIVFGRALTSAYMPLVVTSTSVVGNIGGSSTNTPLQLGVPSTGFVTIVPYTGTAAYAAPTNGIYAFNVSWVTSS